MAGAPLPEQTTEVAVLGGGLQGCCIALELARHGIAVTLIEQDPHLLNRASLRNEGKIHLGLVYANDASLATGRLQLRGALSFHRLLRRWIDFDVNELGLSTPFDYLVARDSIKDCADLADYYALLTGVYRDYLARAPQLDYLGTRPVELARPMSAAALAAHYCPERFAGGFHTAELALDPAKLARLVRGVVDRNPRIRVLCSARVERVAQHRQLAVEYTLNGTRPMGLLADHVVNATWVNRLAIDTAFGLPVNPGWVHRLKYRVITRLPAASQNGPSATVVIGRYGDVVIRPDATAYLSWYPDALLGWSHDLSPPPDWDRICSAAAHPDEARRIAGSVIESIAAWYPGMKNGQCITVDAGAIFAHGETDVDDVNSALHQRTDIGTWSSGHYYSVNPGKLTTAPLMAVLAAQKITGEPAADLGPVEPLLSPC